MSGILNKLKDFVGLNDPADDYYEYDETGRNNYQTVYQQESASQTPPPPTADRGGLPLRDRPLVGTTSTSLSPTTTTTSDISSKMNSATNIIGLPGTGSGASEVVVMEPRSFEEMPQAIQALRERKSVVLNLTIMDPDQAQRAVDFIAGGTYALDGHQERIGESIFLFTPSCVQVSTQNLIPKDPMQPPIRTPRPPSAVPAASWPEQGRLAQ
jgi:cell division inhibitor SepF